MTQEFPPCRMEYGKDEQGNDILLKDGKFQVMMQWEKPYMHACIDALKPFGDVLEIGFGLGYSAERIQTYHPKSHTIIEFHPDVAAKAREWAKNYPSVKIIEDTWQNALPKLGEFDCIFFDDYPLHSEEAMQQMKEESERSSQLVQRGKELIKGIEETLPFLLEIKYSDEDLSHLSQSLSREESLQFACFLQELLKRQQITETQFQHHLEKLKSKHQFTEQELAVALKKPTPKELYSTGAPGDRFFNFLGSCLKSHMRKGARFSCFLSSPVSKYEDIRFVNEIIANPYLDFHEEEISIDVPKNCAYFSGNKALVIVITKAM